MEQSVAFISSFVEVFYLAETLQAGERGRAKYIVVEIITFLESLNKF